MAVDSGTFTPETFENRRKVADALLMQAVKPREIRHWLQGVGQMGEAAVAGVLGGLADREQREGGKAQNEAFIRMLNNGGPQPSEPASMPAPASPAPVGPTSDATVPLGSSRGPEAGMDANAKAIASIESGGRYDLQGPVISSGSMAGQRANGKYQVMDSNVGPWTEKYLGRRMTPDEFRVNPDAQEKVFQGEFGRLAALHGPEGAARAWFAGERGMNDPNRRDQLGTTVQAYGDKFTKAGGGAPAVAAALNAPPQVAQAGGDMRGRIVEMLQSGNPYVQRAGRKLAEGIIQKQLEGEKPTDDIRDYEYAKRQGFKGSLQDWITSKRSGAGEYGLTPIWGTGPDGKPAFIQPGKAGKAIQGQIPEGFNIAKDPIKLDAGTDWILLDPQTRQPVGRVSKNIEQKEAAEERGKATGQAQVNLDPALAKAQMALDTIEKVRAHPGRSMGTGAILGQVPGIPGTSARGFVGLVDQLKGQVFLDAFESLKGGGAITEVEGKKAEQARARLDRAQTDADFDAALNDLTDIVKSGMARAKSRAGGITAPGAAAPPPAATGAAPNIDDLLKKYSK